MTATDPMPRSPLLMSRSDTALMVIDVQEKLIPHIRDADRIVWNIGRLLEAARLLEVVVVATDQYPQGLGPTITAIAERFDDVACRSRSKTRFSGGECRDLFDSLMGKGIHKLLVTGIETHVCVLQTGLDLLTAGFEVYVCVDAVGARKRLDHKIGLRRLELAGASLVTTESTLFEWCEHSRDPTFKAISGLVQQAPPSATNAE